MAALPDVAPAALSEAELCRRISRGDQKAFEHLMRVHNRKLFRVARAILRDDAEAEDAMQEAYLQAYRSVAGFRGEAKLSTWLVRLVANEALARRRKHERRSNIVPIAGSSEDFDIASDPSMTSYAGPDGQAERQEIRRVLEQKIDQLPDGYRAVFVLRALEELSVEETATALGLHEATVRSRFFRARSQLREALSREIDLAFDDAFAFAGDRCDRIVARVLAKLNQ
jgi:RNA polymerase sigma-70 factor (ECF subfamily)